MNIAVLSILLLYLVTPGLLFKRLYFTTEYSKPRTNKGYFDDIIWGTIPSTLIHLIALWISKNVLGLTLDVDLVIKLITHIKDEDILHECINMILLNKNIILIYFVWVNLFAFCLGVAMQWMVRLLTLDILFRLFRFNNRWSYLLYGDTMQFPENFGYNNIRYEIDMTYIDALVKDGNEYIMYSGALSEYYTDKNGELETLVLADVTKSMTIITNKGKEKIIKNFGVKHDLPIIPGSGFIIPYLKILNFNITFLTYFLDNTDLMNNFRRTRKLADKFNSLFRCTLPITVFLIFSIIIMIFIEDKSFLFYILHTIIIIFLSIPFYFIRNRYVKQNRIFGDEIAKNDFGVKIVQSLKIQNNL